MPTPFGVSKEDILRSKIVTPGWYAAVVKSVAQKAAKTDGSTNTIISFKVVGGTYDGVPIDTLFSEKAPGFAVPLMEALLGRKISPDGEQVDFEKAVGKEILIYVKNGMFNNRPKNEIEDYRPKV